MKTINKFLPRCHTLMPSWYKISIYLNETVDMQPCNKISPHQMQLEIQLHHPLQMTQKQTVTEMKIQQQDQEVCVSSRTIHGHFVFDVCTDHGAEE